jgi:hypothetical protein
MPNLEFSQICWYFTDSWEQFRISGIVDVIDGSSSDPAKLQVRAERSLPCALFCIVHSGVLGGDILEKERIIVVKGLVMLTVLLVDFNMVFHTRGFLIYPHLI